MSEAAWWRHLKGDPSRFILDDDEPGAVWRAMVLLLGRPVDSPAVERARRACRERGPAAAILAEQSPEGFWGSPTAYGARWHGSAWQLTAALAFGADADDPRVARGCERLLALLEGGRGGFSPSRTGSPSPCFTARLAGALMRAGFARHPRVREAVAWLLDGAVRQEPWPCSDRRHAVDGTCVIAVVALLHLVTEAPDLERRQLDPMAETAGAWLSERALLLDRRAVSGWRTFAYPNLGRTDLLEALTGLAGVGWPPSPPIARALLDVLARQDGSGRWALEADAAAGGRKGEPSRWLTIEALRCLSAYAEALAGGER